MKVAVTYEDGKVFQHFGHTEYFKIYDVKDGKVVGSEIIPTDGSGHGALAGFLATHKADALICGGIGGGALNALSEAGIRVLAGVSGDADSRVDEFVEGTLVSVRRQIARTVTNTGKAARAKSTAAVTAAAANDFQNKQKQPVLPTGCFTISNC